MVRRDQIGNEMLIAGLISACDDDRVTDRGVIA